MHCYWEDKRKHCIKIILIHLTRIKWRKGQTGAKLVQGNTSLVVIQLPTAAERAWKETLQCSLNVPLLWSHQTASSWVLSPRQSSQLIGHAIYHSLIKWLLLHLSLLVKWRSSFWLPVCNTGNAVWSTWFITSRWVLDSQQLSLHPGGSSSPSQCSGADVFAFAKILGWFLQ